jgi:hypothetical protein
MKRADVAQTASEIDGLDAASTAVLRLLQITKTYQESDR